MAISRSVRRPFPWNKLWRLRLHRVTGRSGSCRRMEAWIRRRTAALGASSRLLPGPAPGLVAGDAPAVAAAGLDATGVHQGYRLADAAVAEIRAFALAAPCTHAAGDGERFRFGDLRDGVTPGGTAVALADVDLTRPSPAIVAIARDPLLVETATRYLGYPASAVATRLFWSPAARLSDDLRRRDAQTIDFHYDIDPARTLYAFFYLTPTDGGSGAHVVLPGTHGSKPMAIVLGSTFQSAERLRALYGDMPALVIEGGPGFGFIEDPACFHRALPPRTADRLCLQLRYS